MFGKALAFISLSAALLLLAIIQTTSPSLIGPAGLLAVFFLLYVMLLGVFTGSGWVVALITVKLSRLFAVRRPLELPNFRRIYYFASVLALGPVIMLATKSIGSLRIYEITLVGIFLSIALFYVSKRDF